MRAAGWILPTPDGAERLACLRNALMRRYEDALRELMSRLAALDVAASAELAEILARVDAIGVNRARLLVHPLFTDWIAKLGAAVSAGDRRTCRDLLIDLGNLTIVELAHAGVAATQRLRVFAARGQIRFPTAPFHVQLDEGAASDVVIGRTDGGRIRIDTPEGEIAFSPCGRSGDVRLRRHAVEPTLSLRVDDTEPAIAEYLRDFTAEEGDRIGGHRSFELRGDARTDSSYMLDLATATELLRVSWPEAADEVRSLVRLVVPLHKTGSEPDYSVSFTAKRFCGAIFVTVEEPVRFAELLVHESGHVKLDQIMALDPVVLRSSEPWVWSPFRGEPRPLSGLIHGAYTYLRIAWYYERVAATGGKTTAVSSRLEEIVGQLDESADILLAQSHYSEFGGALVLALTGEIRELAGRDPTVASRMVPRPR
jgi:HEXXH motif-containing protein